jgi:hypothetical protein
MSQPSDELTPPEEFKIFHLKTLSASYVSVWSKLHELMENKIVVVLT